MSSPASIAVVSKKRSSQAGVAVPTSPQPQPAGTNKSQPPTQPAQPQQQQPTAAAPSQMQSQMSVASSVGAQDAAITAGQQLHGDEKSQSAVAAPPALSPSASSSSVSMLAAASSPTGSTTSAAAIPQSSSSSAAAAASSTAAVTSTAASSASSSSDSAPTTSSSTAPDVKPLQLSQSRMGQASQSPAPMSARAARDEPFDSDGGGPSAHRRALTTFQHSAPAAPDNWIDFPTQQRAVSGGAGTGAGGSGGATSDPSSSAGSPTHSSLTGGSSSPPLLHGDLPGSASLYMQGMLTKKGRNLGFGLGFWRTTRLYMLTDTTLSYTDKTKKEVKGNHLVEEFKSVTRMNSRRWPNRCLTLVFEDNKVWHLRAPTATECTDWLDSLSKAIANAATRKARWRFVRDNAQMQQMQQMQQMGVQTQFGTVPLHVAQQQMDLAQMGMMQMPMPMPMPMPPLSPSAGGGALMPPFQMHPMLAMHPAQYAQMGLPVLPMHPAAYEASMQQQYADAMPMAADAAPRIKTRSRTNLQAPSSSSAGVGSATLLQRHDSRGRGMAGAVGSDASGLPVDSSPNEMDADGAMSSDDAEVHTEDETDGEAEGADEGEAGSEGDFVSEMEDEAYDTGITPRFMPTAQTLAAYNPYTQQAAAFNAATYAQWTRAQAAAQQMSDASLFNPAEQSSLNAAKDKLGWAMALLSMVGATILILGHEGRTTSQIFGLLAGLVGGGGGGGGHDTTALVPVSSSSSSPAATAVVTVSNVTDVVASNATVVDSDSASDSLPSWSLLSSLLSVRWSVLLLLLSLLAVVFFGLSLKKHKSRAKKQRQAEKAAKAAQKKEQDAQRANGTLNAAQLSAQQQQEWKAQSRILAVELAQATRLMSGLAASAAFAVATAAYVWRAA